MSDIINYSKFGSQVDSFIVGAIPQGPPGVGFVLTEEGNYDIQNKDFENVKDIKDVNNLDIRGCISNDTPADVCFNSNIDLQNNNIIDPSLISQSTTDLTLDVPSGQALNLQTNSLDRMTIEDANTTIENNLILNNVLADATESNKVLILDSSNNVTFNTDTQWVVSSYSSLSAPFDDSNDVWDNDYSLLLTANSIPEGSPAQIGENITTSTATCVAQVNADYSPSVNHINLTWDANAGEFTMTAGTYSVAFDCSFKRDSGTGDRFFYLHYFINGTPSTLSCVTTEVSGSTEPLFLSCNITLTFSEGDTLGFGISQIHPGGSNLSDIYIGNINFQLIKLSTGAVIAENDTVLITDTIQGLTGSTPLLIEDTVDDVNINSQASNVNIQTGAINRIEVSTANTTINNILTLNSITEDDSGTPLEINHSSTGQTIDLSIASVPKFQVSNTSTDIIDILQADDIRGLSTAGDISFGGANGVNFSDGKIRSNIIGDALDVNGANGLTSDIAHYFDGGVYTDDITAINTDVTINNTLLVDTINEASTDNGVDIETCHLENGEIGLGISSPDANIHIQNAGNAYIFCESDTDNVSESDQARIYLSQDANLIAGYLGYDEALNHLSIVTSTNVAGTSSIKFKIGDSTGSSVGSIPSISSLSEIVSMNDTEVEFSVPIQVDTINEQTSDNGVTIDGVLCKDNDLETDQLRSDDITDKAGTGAPDFSQGLTLAGGADVLAIYDEETGNLTYDTSDFSSQQTPSYKCVRIGDSVTFTLAGVSATTAATPGTNFGSTDTIGTGFRPSADVRIPIRSYDNSIFVAGFIEVTTAGNVNIYRDIGGLLSFTGEVTGGWDKVNICWSI